MLPKTFLREMFKKCTQDKFSVCVTRLKHSVNNFVFIIMIFYSWSDLIFICRIINETICDTGLCNECYLQGVSEETQHLENIIVKHNICFWEFKIASNSTYSGIWIIANNRCEFLKLRVLWDTLYKHFDVTKASKTTLYTIDVWYL